MTEGKSLATKYNLEPFKIIRLLFGVIWAVDAFLKWTPAFQNGLQDMLSDIAQGQPTLISSWIGMWNNIIGINPHIFALIIALIESSIALFLIFDLFPKTAYIGGFIFSILLWTVGEGFGGPYIAGSTDIGCGIMYAFIFAALYFQRFWPASGENKNAKTKSHSGGNTLTKALAVSVIILIAIIVEPYLITITSTSQKTDMPPGMMMKAFYIGPIKSMNGMITMSPPVGINASTTAPIPTVHFTITKDTLDGWDLHIITTNFTFTPQNVNEAPVADQGHAHLYIDGNITLLLGPWYHIPSTQLPPGKHIITVSLNANDHSVFSANGTNIEETQTLIVPPF